jgi:hypothetical protein
MVPMVTSQVRCNSDYEIKMTGFKPGEQESFRYHCVRARLQCLLEALPEDYSSQTAKLTILPSFKLKLVELYLHFLTCIQGMVDGYDT